MQSIREKLHIRLNIWLNGKQVKKQRFISSQHWCKIFLNGGGKKDFSQILECTHCS